LRAEFLDALLERRVQELALLARHVHPRGLERAYDADAIGDDVRAGRVVRRLRARLAQHIGEHHAPLLQLEKHVVRDAQPGRKRRRRAQFERHALAAAALPVFPRRERRRYPAGRAARRERAPRRVRRGRAAFHHGHAPYRRGKHGRRRTRFVLHEQREHRRFAARRVLHWDAIGDPFPFANTVHSAEEAQKDALTASQRVILRPPLANRQARVARQVAERHPRSVFLRC
jgi:hypothetical protein